MPLVLNDIATRLGGLEEAIIHKLLDRAQFCQNAEAYEPGSSGFLPQEAASLFELRLLYQEQMDAAFGRYLVPEERPFYQGLPPAKRPLLLPDSDLCIGDFDLINVSGKILVAYLDLLPQLCRSGDDGHHGSSVEHDVIALQALARRVHFGALFVAESKYQARPDLFQPLIEARDEDGLLTALTRPEQEAAVLVRVREKTAAIQALSDPHSRHLVSPEVLSNTYRDWIIPLTKEGQVRYLLQRRP